MPAGRDASKGQPAGQGADKDPPQARRAGTSETDIAEEIRNLCAGEGGEGTAYKIAARTAAESVERVIVAESHLKDAALSLGHEEELSGLIAELRQVADTLLSCRGDTGRGAVPLNEGMESMKPALPQWWFALSEVLQVAEREIEFLASIGHGQPRSTAARQLCTLTIRVLRKHYRLILDEAEEWISVSDDV